MENSFNIDDWHKWPSRVQDEFERISNDAARAWADLKVAQEREERGEGDHIETAHAMLRAKEMNKKYEDFLRSVKIMTRLLGKD